MYGQMIAVADIVQQPCKSSRISWMLLRRRRLPSSSLSSGNCPSRARVVTPPSLPMLSGKKLARPNRHRLVFSKRCMRSATLRTMPLSPHHQRARNPRRRRKIKLFFVYSALCFHSAFVHLASLPRTPLSILHDHLTTPHAFLDKSTPASFTVYMTSITL